MNKITNTILCRLNIYLSAYLLASLSFSRNLNVRFWKLNGSQVGSIPQFLLINIFLFKQCDFVPIILHQGVHPCKLSYSFLLINVLLFIIVFSSFFTDFLFCIFKLCVRYL